MFRRATIDGTAGIQVSAGSASLAGVELPILSTRTARGAGCSGGESETRAPEA